MKETKRLSSLFENLYNGRCWLDVTLLGTLQHVTAEVAATKVNPVWNSVWEIVNHLISWRKNVLQRVQGIIIPSPENNYFSPVTDQSEAAWQNTLQQLEESQQEWIKFLDTTEESNLDKTYSPSNFSYYENIHGIVQHDAYHLGQVVLMVKAQQSQPE